MTDSAAPSSSLTDTKPVALLLSEYVMKRAPPPPPPSPPPPPQPTLLDKILGTKPPIPSSNPPKNNKPVGAAPGYQAKSRRAEAARPMTGPMDLYFERKLKSAAVVVFDVDAAEGGEE